MKGIGKGFAGLDMFGGYSKDSWEMPDNRLTRSFCCPTPEIVVCGATNRLTSAIEGVSLEYVSDAALYIQSGLDSYWKPMECLELEEDGRMLWIGYEMPPEESARIDYRSDFRYQAKITLKSGEIVYAPMAECRAMPSLEVLSEEAMERELETELLHYEPIEASEE